MKILAIMDSLCVITIHEVDLRKKFFKPFGILAVCVLPDIKRLSAPDKALLLVFEILHIRQKNTTRILFCSSNINQFLSSLGSSWFSRTVRSTWTRGIFASPSSTFIR